MKFFLVGLTTSDLFGSGSSSRNMSAEDMCDYYGITLDELRETPLLESFFYATPLTRKVIPLLDDFLLDSGAFTFMTGAGSSPDWDSYLDRYARFIVENDVANYFEMDVDSIVGYERVKEFRRRLERETGRRCIPVFHLSRGRREFEAMCDEYDYVAFGGMRTDGISDNDLYEVLPWFVREAHRRGTRIHGLGFTRVSQAHRIRFDTVDSSSWTHAFRHGMTFHFIGGGGCATSSTSQARGSQTDRSSRGTRSTSG